jgi:hypothetical protein
MLLAENLDPQDHCPTALERTQAASARSLNDRSARDAGVTEKLLDQPNINAIIDQGVDGGLKPASIRRRMPTGSLVIVGSGDPRGLNGLPMLS